MGNGETGAAVAFAAPDGGGSPRRRGLGEVRAVWIAWAFVLLFVFLTYARFGPEELYHVSRRGLAGGASRMLVELNFPVALIAIALTLLVLDALPRRARIAGVASIAACAVTAWPGVVDQGDLDAKWINVAPALGVVVALVLSLEALRREGAAMQPRRPFDGARIALALAIGFISLPWIAATAGVFLPDVLFLTGRRVVEDGHVAVAVHHGLHHGFDGAVMAVCALVLSRIPLVHGGRAVLTRAYLALLIGYGIVNAVQDAWGEQIVKRGWSTSQIPSAAEPRLHPVWGVVLVVATAAWLVLRAEDRRSTST